MSVIFKTSLDPVIVTDPIAQLFISYRSGEEAEKDPKVRENLEKCLQYGRRMGVTYPAGVIYASYIRWLRMNSHSTFARFLAMNGAHQVFERYLQVRYRSTVVYPDVFHTTTQ